MLLRDKCYCRQSTLQCQLHIVFHAEGQSYDAIGDVFVRNAGYIEWAVNVRYFLLFPFLCSTNQQQKQQKQQQ